MLVRTDGERRAVVRAVLEKGASAGLVAFCIVDTHLHALFVGRRDAVGEAMRRIELSCHMRLGLGDRFDGARILPVRDQGHFRNVVPYVLGQVVRHQLVTDPLQEGSSLHDLLGLRVVSPGLVAGFQVEQPRLHIAGLWTHFGVSAQEAASFDRPLAADDLRFLREATCAAFAVRAVRPRGAGHQLVRAAMVQAAAGFSARAVGRAAGLTHGSVTRLRRLAVSVHWVSAIRRQVRLRVLRAERDAGEAPPTASSMG